MNLEAAGVKVDEKTRLIQVNNEFNRPKIRNSTGNRDNRDMNDIICNI